MSEERYDILKLLGKGRTGGVYEAEDTRLGRKVAMRRFFSQNELTDVSEYEEEFKQIAQSLSALQHPNLLRVFDAGMDEDGAFIISQQLKGDTLHNRLKEGPLPNWDVWDLGHQMLDALSTAHDGGFVHGAITPGSILMSPRARGGYLYVILDMGLSRLAPLIQGQDSVLSMMADPAILAPELFDGSEATEKSDLYMLGNILYMCLAGGHPFAGKSLEDCAQLHSQGLPDLTEFAPDAPQDLLDWIGDLCEIDPQHRPSSVVVALKSMPIVAKPVKTGITPIHTTAGAPALSPASNLTAHPQSTYGHQAPGMMTTGPLTAGAGVPQGVAVPQEGAMPQTTHGQLLNKYQAPEKSYKALIITISALLVLGIALFFMMSGGGKKTGEQIAAEKAKKAKKEQAKEARSPADAADNVDNIPKQVPAEKKFQLEEVTSFKILNGKLLAQGWKAVNQKQNRLTMNGWSIVGATGQNPGVGKLITATDTEDMFKRGWTLKYVVYTRQGGHKMGFQISADENEYWGNKQKPVRAVLGITNVDGKLKISGEESEGVIEVGGAANSFLEIEMRGKANDPSGSFQLYLNGKLVDQFVGKISQADRQEKNYQDKVFSASGDTQANMNNWVIRELTLSTGAPSE